MCVYVCVGVRAYVRAYVRARYLCPSARVSVCVCVRKKECADLPFTAFTLNPYPTTGSRLIITNSSEQKQQK